MVCIAAFVAVFSWWIIPIEVLYVADSLYYLGGAASLAQEHSYRMPLLEGNPANGMYPPLQSVYLSIAWLIDPHFPQNQQLIKALMILLWSVTIAVLFAVLRRGGLRRVTSALIAICVGTSGGWIYFVAHAFSDVLFSMLALCAAWLWVTPDATRGERLFMRIAISGVILGFMYCTRIATFGFLPGVVIASAFCSWRMRSWKPLLLMAIPVVVAITLWSLMPKETFGYGPYAAGEIERHGGVSSYLAYAIRFCTAQSIDYFNGKFLLQGLSTDVSGLLAAILPGSSTWLSLVNVLLGVSGAAFLAIAVFGAWRTPEHRVLQAAGATYALQLLVWPFPLGLRGLLPLLPLAIVWAGRGLRSFPARWARAAKTAGAVYLTLCLLGNVAGSGHTRELLDSTRKMTEAAAAGNWIRDNIPADARLASDLMLPILHVHAASERPITYVPHNLSASFGFDYVLAAGGFPVDRPIGSMDRPHFTVVWESDGKSFQVLRKMEAVTPEFDSAALSVQRQPE